MNPTLANRAKKFAESRHRTFTSIVEEALTRLLEESPKRKSKRVKLPSFRSGGTLPGINLDKTSEVLEQIEPHRYEASGR
jgi:hypothetical protein